LKLPRDQVLASVLFFGITLLFFVVNGEVGETGNGRAASDNSYMDGADYIGSDLCAGCHPDKGNTWMETNHAITVIAPTADTVLADFSVQPSIDEDVTIYHQEGTDDYYINLAGNNYTVDWIQGGGGAWRQLYMVNIENGTYILPLQWNTATSEWVAYSPEDWFDPDGSPAAHDWGFGGEPIKQIDMDKSWQKNCAGCHTTGNTPLQNGNDEWVDNFNERGITCESCHGPGSEHLDGFGDPERIWVSTNANVCSQCHVRGTSLDGNHLFPVGMFPGDRIQDHFNLAEDSFWPDGTSKLDAQQWVDWNHSAHADPTPSFARKASCANCHTPEGAMELFQDSELEQVPGRVTWNVACVSCHGPHGTGNEQILRVEKEDLCVACHTYEDAVPGDTPHHPMQEMLMGNGGADQIGDLLMGGAITCTDCHMPFTSQSGVAFDIASHTFDPIEPQLSIEYGMPNSCTGSCHNGDGSGNRLTDATAQRVIDTWHGEIDTMLVYVEDNLTGAQTNINIAKLQGIDPSLITQAEELLVVATFNHQFVDNDGSRGAHNFEYARVLLYDSYQKTQEIATMLDVEPVENVPPLVDPGEPKVALVDTLLTFEAQAFDPDGTNLTFLWEFGDGAQATQAVAKHAFASPGEYLVTLTVTDEDNMTTTETVPVFIVNSAEDIAGLKERTGDLEDRTDELDELTEQNQDDLASKIGPMAILGVLVVTLIIVAGVYYHLNEQLRRLQETLEAPPPDSEQD